MQNWKYFKNLGIYGEVNQIRYHRKASTQP
jgi:hypothetical protein